MRVRTMPDIVNKCCCEQFLRLFPHIQMLKQDACEVENAERMLKSRVVRTRINEIREAELPDSAKSLHLTRV
ncbi:MAG: hypothetical protein MW690_001411 [Methanophagales archaeon]|nr:hypothetical protein [Methanophagales archaeon]